MPVAGVWTPWAEVLCRHCHDEIDAKEATAKRKIEWPEGEKREGDGPGLCTKCGATVWVHEDVAQLSRLRKLTGGVMEQTGGMCAALAIGRLDGGTGVVTNLDGPLSIGVYGPGEWEEGGAEVQCYCIPEATTDEVAAFVILTAVKEKRKED